MTVLTFTSNLKIKGTVPGLHPEAAGQCFFLVRGNKICRVYVWSAGIKRAFIQKVL